MIIMRKLRVVDLFCGPGGLSEGFQLAGCEVVYGLDNNKDAVATFQHNHPSAKTVKEDATKVNPNSIPDFEILVGGPPCVNFSSSKGNRANVLEGLRLVQAFLRLVYERKPKYWIMENVPRVARHIPNTIPLSWIGIDKKGDLAVPVRHEFNCADYGVPQTRKRYLIGNYPIPPATHFKPSKIPLFAWGCERLPWKTLGDILDCLPRLDAGKEGTITDPNYGFSIPVSKLSDHFHPVELEDEEAKHIKKVKTAHPYMGFMPFPDQVDRPARTVVATQLGRETLVFATNNLNLFRRATVRECATIQTFPISFHFCGNSISSRYKQAGDAVPPKLSLAIAKEILKQNSKMELNNLFFRLNEKMPAPALPAPAKKQKILLPLNKRCREIVPGKEIRGCRVEFDNQGSIPTRARFCGQKCLNIVQWVSRLHLGEGRNAKVVLLGIEDWLKLFTGFEKSFHPSLLPICSKFISEITKTLVNFVPDASTLQAAYTRRSQITATPQAITKLILEIVDKYFPKSKYGKQHILPNADFNMLPKKGLLLRIVAGGYAAALASELANSDTRWLSQNKDKRFIPEFWPTDEINSQNESEIIKAPA